MSVTPVVDHLATSGEAVLDRLCAFLRLPSVSTDPAYADGMEAARLFLLDWMRQIGLSDVQLLEGGGEPAVYGAWLGAPGAPTVIIYGHYDVQPPDPIALWRTPPFEPSMRDGRVYARGAADVKGSTTIALETVAAFLSVTGRCPLNLKVFIEGEEETGSPSLRRIVERHRALLEADAILSADGGRASPELATVNVGARGFAKLEVRVRTAHKELHSGRYGGAVRNALHELCAIIASLHDAGGTIAVPALMADVVDLTEEDRRQSAALPFDEAAFIGDIGGSPAGEPGFTVRERLTLRPALDVNGLWGGYTGSGSKTVIPDEATAKISLRLVAGQDPDRAVQALKAHVLAMRPAGVEIDFSGEQGGAPASSLSADHPLVIAAAEVLRETTGQEPVHVRLGPTVPIISLFKEMMGLETLMFGFNLPDEDVHAPNESFHLASIPMGLKAWAMLLAELGRFTPAELREGKVSSADRSAT